jgi:8-oxo-dGTP pyrophosphatase MutT (NUDIX family)
VQTRSEPLFRRSLAADEGECPSDPSVACRWAVCNASVSNIRESSVADQNNASATHAGAVVAHDTADGPEFLLVTARRNQSEWVLPKGHIEAEEDPATAAAREVREETGVSAEILLPLGRTEYQAGAEIVRTLFFLARAPSGTPQKTNEGRRITWLTEAQAVAALAYPEAKAMLKAAARALSTRSPSAEST